MVSLLNCFLIDLFYLSKYFTPTYICAHNQAWCPWRLEESVKSFEAGIIHSCETPYGCWGLSLSPQEENKNALNQAISSAPVLEILLFLPT